MDLISANSLVSRKAGSPAFKCSSLLRRHGSMFARYSPHTTLTVAIPRHVSSEFDEIISSVPVQIYICIKLPHFGTLPSASYAGGSSQCREFVRIANVLNPPSIGRTVCSDDGGSRSGVEMPRYPSMRTWNAVQPICTFLLPHREYRPTPAHDLSPELESDKRSPLRRCKVTIRLATMLQNPLPRPTYNTMQANKLVSMLSDFHGSICGILATPCRFTKVQQRNMARGREPSRTSRQ